MAKQKTTPTGKVSIADLRSSINKRAGRNVAYNLNFENPTEVKYWIPTGSRWLDSIIAKGVKAGIPGGKITGLAGLTACVSEDTEIDVFIYDENEVEKTVKIKELRKLLEEGKKVKVKSTGGYVDVINFVDKGLQDSIKVNLENDREIIVTPEHRFFSENGWVAACDLQVGATNLLCENEEYSRVVSVKPVGDHPIVDITVHHKDHCYFGNGILNHNTGKSFLAAQITANAQKMGMTCVYFDSEAALDPAFLENAGINLDDLIYVQAKTVEFVLETIEHLLKTSDERMLIVWDSIALTPVKDEAETNFNPQASMALKARVLAEGMTALTDLVADKESTLLVLNQLKTNITSDWGADAFRTPGGMSLKYAYSLEIWLTRRLSKAAYIKNDKGYNVGAEVKAELKKSRFGTERRQCAFNILWGERVGVQDEESWFEAISTSPHYSTGAWNCMVYADGTDTGKFRSSEFVEKLQEPKFRERVLELMDEEIIQKFATMTGSASNFYDVDGSAYTESE